MNNNSAVIKSESLADFTSSINWGGTGYGAYEGRCEVPAASPAAPPAATPAAPVVATPAASPAAPGSAAASPAAGDTKIDWATAPAQLRTAYETTKAQLEKYSALGITPEQVQSAHATYTTIRTEAVELASDLGFTEAQVDRAMQKDPAGTLLWLRNKARESAPPANKDGDVESLVRTQVEQATKPINDYVNKQMTDSANTRFEGEFNRLFDAEYPDKEFPAEIKSAFLDLTSEFIKYDKEALTRLKMDGKVSDVGKYYAQAKSYMEKLFTQWETYQTKKAGANGPPPPRKVGDVAPKLTIDDIIEGNEKAQGALSSMR